MMMYVLYAIGGIIVLGFVFQALYWGFLDSGRATMSIAIIVLLAILIFNARGNLDLDLKTYLYLGGALLFVFYNIRNYGFLAILALLFLNYKLLTKDTHTVPQERTSNIQEAQVTTQPQREEVYNVKKKSLGEMIPVPKKQVKKELDYGSKIPEKYYIVKISTLNVRKKPNEKSEKITKLHKNKKIKVTRKNDDWFYIENVGWVHSKFLKVYTKKSVNQKYTWHCIARSDRASGWVERVGKQNAMNGALHQCNIRKSISSNCKITKCYKIN